MLKDKNSPTAFTAPSREPTTFFKFTVAPHENAKYYLKREETGELIPFDDEGVVIAKLKQKDGSIGETVTIVAYC